MLVIGAPAHTVDRVVEGMASRQHGVVTRGQLYEDGVTRAAIERRLRTGVLLRVYRGVFRVGHRAPSIEATYLAAVLACGDGALLAGRAAGYLLGLLRGRPAVPEVLSPRQRTVTGVIVRRARRPAEGTTWRGIPTTTVPRTLVDLAAVLSSEELARACHEAGVRHRTTPAEVEAVLRRKPNAAGARRLRSILLGDTHITLSKLERRFLTLLEEHALPPPETNTRAGGRRVDCRWPEHRLTVELDGYRYHSSRHAWELDRRRERDAHARGDDFRRYTFGDVLERPRDMLRELRRLLIAPSAPTS